jgi:hypothetical protein
MLPVITYNITFYDREGEVDSIQQHTTEESAKKIMKLFDEPDSSELYRRITLTSYDWGTDKVSLLKELTF